VKALPQRLVFDGNKQKAYEDTFLPTPSLPMIRTPSGLPGTTEDSIWVIKKTFYDILCIQDSTALSTTCWRKRSHHSRRKR
jgi:hypothetical protein